MIEEIIRVPADVDSVQRGFDLMAERGDELAIHLGMIEPITVRFVNDAGKALFSFVLGNRRETHEGGCECSFEEWSQVGGVVLLLTDARGQQAAVRLIAVVNASSESVQ